MSPIDLAREALALAEKATPPPWRWAAWGDDPSRIDTLEADAKHRPNWKPSEPEWVAMLKCRILSLDEPLEHSGYRGREDGDLIAHAGTHYAALARALIAAEERVAQLELMLRAALRSKRKLIRGYPSGYWLARHGYAGSDDGTGLPILTPEARAALARKETP